MNEFNPGDGWREVTEAQWGAMDALTESLERHHADGRTTYWVREVPVPPLPTEPWTVIRVTLKRPSSVPLEWTLHHGGGLWHAPLGYYRGTDDLAGLISGFEVLAEPRAVTAKAVLDAIRPHLPNLRPDGPVIAEIAREFGASS